MTDHRYFGYWEHTAGMIFLMFFIYIAKKGELQQWVNILFYAPRQPPMVPAEASADSAASSGSQASPATAAAAGAAIGAAAAGPVGMAAGAIAGAASQAGPMQPFGNWTSKGALFGAAAGALAGVPGAVIGAAGGAAVGGIADLYSYFKSFSNLPQPQTTQPFLQPLQPLPPLVPSFSPLSPGLSGPAQTFGQQYLLPPLFIPPGGGRRNPGDDSVPIA